MGLWDYFEERFEELSSKLDKEPELKGLFFLVYQLPSGNLSEVLRTGKRFHVHGEMEKELKAKLPYGVTIEYMCRRLGEAHGQDDYEPREFLHDDPMKKLADWKY